MTTIFRGTLSQTMNIRNLLEGNGIEVFTINEHMSSIEPWVVASGGFNPVVLKINDEDLEKAEKIIEDFQSGDLEIQ